MRKAWKSYFPKVDGIIYLVDAAAPERFEESKTELDGILNQPELASVPICILGNKIDCKNAVGEEELRLVMGCATQNQFGVQKVDIIDNRPIEVFMCSIASQTGYAKGFKWIGDFLK